MIYLFLCIFWSSARILGKPTLSLGRNKSDSRSLVLKMSFRSQVDTIQWYMWANVAHVSITTHRLSLKWRLIIYFDALNSMLQLAFPYGSMSEISSSGWRSKLDPAKLLQKEYRAVRWCHSLPSHSHGMMIVCFVSKREQLPVNNEGPRVVQCFFLLIPRVWYWIFMRYGWWTTWCTKIVEIFKWLAGFYPSNLSGIPEIWMWFKIENYWSPQKISKEWRIIIATESPRKISKHRGLYRL